MECRQEARQEGTRRGEGGGRRGIERARVYRGTACDSRGPSCTRGSCPRCRAARTRRAPARLCTEAHSSSTGSYGHEHSTTTDIIRAIRILTAAELVPGLVIFHGLLLEALPLEIARVHVLHIQTSNDLLFNNYIFILHSFSLSN